jgi:hypothetical protein
MRELISDNEAAGSRMMEEFGVMKQRFSSAFI